MYEYKNRDAKVTTLYAGTPILRSIAYIYSYYKELLWILKTCLWQINSYSHPVSVCMKQQRLI